MSLRHRKSALLAALAASTAFSCATVKGEAASEEEERPVVTKVEIQGNKGLSRKQLEERISTTQTGWWPFAEQRYFDDAAFDLDMRRIERLYRAEGFYEAKVVDRQVVPASPRTVEVRIQVEEGAPVIVDKVELSGIEELEPGEQALLSAVLPLPSGARFREEDFDRSKALLLERLREMGFAEAEVEGSAEVSLAEHRAHVAFDMTPGKRYVFGKTFIAGLSRVKREPVAAEVATAIGPGKLYTDSALQEAQRRVFDLGVFAGVKVTRGAPDREAQTVPVTVYVREAKFQSLRLGGGIGLDQSRQEGRVIAEYVNRNLFPGVSGGLQRLTFYNKLGYAFLPTVFSATDSSQRGVTAKSTLELKWPRVFAPQLAIATAAEYERGIELNYQFDSGRGRVGLPWRVSNRFVVMPSYNLEFYRLTGAAVAQGPSVSGLGPQCTAPPCNLLLSYLEGRLSYDHRDDATEPRSGYHLSLSLQAGGNPFRGPFFLPHQPQGLGGDFDYWRVLPEARFYASARSTVFAVKLKLGTLFTAKDQTGTAQPSPIVARFYAGGQNSVRGFGSRRLSPMFLQEDGTVERNTAKNHPECLDANGQIDPSLGGQCLNASSIPAGGNGLFEGSAEARIELVHDLSLVLFTDVGFVSDSAWQLFSALKQPFIAPGVGLRYKTQFGPLRVDLVPRTFGPFAAFDAARFQNGLRAATEQRWVVFQLSLGEAF